MARGEVPVPVALRLLQKKRRQAHRPLPRSARYAAPCSLARLRSACAVLPAARAYSIITGHKQCGEVGLGGGFVKDGLFELVFSQVIVRKNCDLLFA